MLRTILNAVLFAIFTLLTICSVDAATISGTIKFDGEAPKFKEIKMDADPVCVTLHSGPVYPQTLVLGEGNTMGNVFVHIKKGLNQGNYPVPAEEIVIDQKGCEYHPHVAGVMAGQSIKVLNPDGTLHNVHVLSKTNPEANIAMPKFRKDITMKFDKPEFMFAMKCDVHPWMGAWLSVMPHPFFARMTGNSRSQIFQPVHMKWKLGMKNWVLSQRRSPLLKVITRRLISHSLRLPKNNHPYTGILWHNIMMSIN